MPNADDSLEKFQTVRKFIDEVTEILHNNSALKASEANSRMAAENFQTKEKKYREILDNLPQRIYVKDKNFTYIFCNKSYGRDLQLKPDEIVGKRWRPFPGGIGIQIYGR